MISENRHARFYCCLVSAQPTMQATMLPGEFMSKTRRNFLINASAGVLAASAVRAAAQTEPPPGTPPAFGTGPQVGPEVSASTFAEAEKLVQVVLTQNERTVAANSWRSNMASLYER